MQVLKRFPPLPSRKNIQHPNNSTLPLSLAPYIKPYKVQSAKAKIRLLQSQQPHSQRNDTSLNKRNQSIESIQSTNARSNSCEYLAKIKVNKIKNLQNNGMICSELPDVTAKSWILFQLKENNCIYGKRNHKKREMASLTKIMNLVTILEMIQRFNINPHKLKVKPTKSSMSMIGTTADLKPSHIYSLYDLLHGMMLPSGNDSAYLISELAGLILKLQKEKERFTPHELYNNPSLLVDYLDKNNNLVNIYLKEMNKVAQRLQMFSSNFANPHGLSNTANYSTANDLAKLCSFGLKNKVFRQIVTTKSYAYHVQLYELEESDKENVEGNGKVFVYEKSVFSGIWENTNKMLDEGWSGIKTGITPNAGPCLSASFAKTIKGRDYQFLVILLNSQSMQARWQQVRNLVSWAIQKKYYL